MVFLKVNIPLLGFAELPCQVEWLNATLSGIVTDFQTSNGLQQSRLFVLVKKQTSRAHHVGAGVAPRGGDTWGNVSGSLATAVYDVTPDTHKQTSHASENGHVQVGRPCIKAPCQKENSYIHYR